MQPTDWTIIMLVKTTMIALALLLASAGYLISPSLGDATSVVAGAYPPCVLINRPPAPFGERLAAHRPAVPLPGPGHCEN